jgi:hypothetical protein
MTYRAAGHIDDATGTLEKSDLAYDVGVMQRVFVHQPLGERLRRVLAGAVARAVRHGLAGQPAS